MTAIQKIAAEINAKTGWTGQQLTDAVRFYGMMLATVQGNEKAASHFETKLAAR